MDFLEAFSMALNSLAQGLLNVSLRFLDFLDLNMISPFKRFSCGFVVEHLGVVYKERILQILQLTERYTARQGQVRELHKAEGSYPQGFGIHTY